jgi:vacuolar-type H+-ATPase subunit I/STV1
VIWWWNEWKNDSDRLAQLRAYSEQLRVEGWLQKANVKTISDAIKSSAKVPDDVANVMAFNILRNPNCSIIIDAMWGVRKLKTKVEEL